MIDDKNGAERMPQTIGRYEVKECVGFGAMGAVYKGFDPLIKRTLAIKTIRLDIPRQSPQYKSFIERFYREARISGTLSHPNIVTLFDIGEEAGLPYLAMEYVEGETLSAMIEKGTRFKPETVVGLVSQVASAIDYAHGMGVVHRDIKPSNLILSNQERIKVTDFGIAKLVDAEMTQSGTLLGTPAYMSPEQAMGEAVDGRSDIFSLGVCAFEMLSGEQPFPGNNVTAILYKLAHVDPIEPANLELNGLVPDKWHEVFGKVLAKKPDERYQVAADFVRDLEYCLGSWFGSAVGDETMTTGPTAAPAASEPTGPMARPASNVNPIQPARPAVPVVPDNLTRPMKAGAPPLVPAPVSPDRTIVMPAAGVPTPPLAEAPLATMVMATASAAATSAPAPEPDVERTIVMPGPKAPALPPVPPPTTAMARPGSATPSQVVPAVPEQEEERTFVMPAPTAGPVVPTAPESEEERTFVMSAPQAPQAAAPEREEERTIVMAGAKPAKAQEGTSSVSPLTIQAPSPMRPAPGPESAPPAPMATMVMPSTQKVPEAEAHAVPAAPPPTTAVGRSPAAPVVPPAVPASRPAAPSGEPKKGLPVGLIVGAVLALLFMGAVLIGGVVLAKKFLALPSPAPTPEAVLTPVAPPPTPPEVVPTPVALITGTLAVESEPTGASVSVNGELRGVTPLTLDGLALGDYEVKVESKGYQPFTQKVALTSADSLPVRAVLSRALPVTATIDVLSTPFGAVVVLDGTGVGQTPLTGYKLKPGPHRIEVARAGFEPWFENIRLAAGQSQRVDATLKPLPAPTPSPTLAAVDPNKVYAKDDVDTAPRKLSGSTASYPEDAKRLKSGESVSAKVTYVVTETGQVTDVKVVESAGKLVDEAVVAAVKAWKYAPGQKRGVNVKVLMSHTLTFRSG